MKPTRLEPTYSRFSPLGPSLFLVACLLYGYLSPSLPASLWLAPLVYTLAALSLFLLQELAFLFAAKLLGFGPYSVYLGIGASRGAVSLLNTNLGWSSASPLLSYWLGSTSPRAFRLRLLLLSLVRPLLALAALLYARAALLAPDLPAWARTPAVQSALLLALLVSVLRFCWMSKRFDAKGGTLFSDRHLLRKALCLTPKKLHANIEHAYSTETNLLIASRKYPEAKKKLFAAIDLYPNSVPLRKTLISVAFYVEDYPSARKHAQQLLALPTLSPEERFVLHYQAACAALMSKHLDEARQEAELLREAAPEHPPTLCLLGALDIQQGRPEQGAAVMEKVLAQDKSSEVQAECYAWLSIAASKKCDPQRAQELLLQARQFNSREQTLQLAYQELQEAKAQDRAAHSVAYRS